MSGPNTVALPSATDDLRLAQLHLRLGQLTLARAELEDLAGRVRLDLDALTALAEARWRTGAGDAAAEAADAHLAGGGTDPIAICIVAEAAAAAGKPEEARALIERIGALEPAQVDALFAGMPRRAVWPVGDTIDAPPASAFPGPQEVLEATGLLGAPARQYDPAAPPSPPPSGPAERERHSRATWDSAAEVRRARDELGARPERAFVRLALVLRLDPTLAPAVLDAVALRREPAAALIRGDAQRLLGRHLEAEAAFDAAAQNLEDS